MNNNIFKWFITALLSGIIFSSCDKYLDVQPKGVRLLETVTDFDLWLDNEYLATSVPGELNLFTDYKDNTSIKNPPQNDPDLIYTWHHQFSDDIKTPPVIWKDFYQAIYYYNTVIQGVDAAIGGSPEQIRSLKAEAYLGRAFNYLYLVNLYGKQYNHQTAEKDLAVPFVTSNDLNKPTPDRSSVQEIYDYIIADLTAAIPDLPEDNSQNRFRGSVAAAYSVLARTYLYMGDYSKAAQNAQLALDNGVSAILDYSTMTKASDIPYLKKRVDAIYARFSNNRAQQEYPTLAYLQSFDTKDYRLNFYFSNSFFSADLGNYVFTIRGLTSFYPGGVANGTTAHPNSGTSVAEMRLIIAEAAARANDLTTALNQLDLIRKCRFPANYYVKFQSTDQEEVLQKVLTERTFEFAFNGLRWLDMRRLDSEGRMAQVIRYDNLEEVVAILPPHSYKYTLQIPVQVLYFHPDWPQNQWDD